MLCCFFLAAPGNEPPPPPGAPRSPIEREVIDNLQHQPLGDQSVEVLNLPEDYLRRVAGRVIRESFEERFRIVVPLAASADRPAADGRASSPPPTTSPAAPDDLAEKTRLLLWGAAFILVTLIIMSALRGRRAEE